MNTRIMQIFYAADCLPYKDQERTVHFPIVGTSFQGASNTTEIRFYIKDIGDEHTTWVANAKLPNGKIGSKVLDLTFDSTLNEWYASLPLSTYYTQAKGDLYISLQGYQGGVEVEEVDTDTYEITGTPTIQATGSVKITIAYATQFNNSAEELDDITLAQLLALIGTKANGDEFDELKEHAVEFLLSGTDSEDLESVYTRFGTRPFIFYKSGSSYLCKILNYHSGGMDTSQVYIFDFANVRYSTYTDSSLFDTHTFTYFVANATYHTIDSVVSVGTASGSLSNSNYDKIAQFPSAITYNGEIYVHCKTDVSYLYFKKILLDDISSASNYKQHSESYFKVAITSPHTYSLTTTITNFYDKDQIDSLIATIKQDEYIVITDFTTYPTLQDFLDNYPAEEGHIYLYPVDISESPTFDSGYYRYLYENDVWIALGTTNIDLSQYYTKDETDDLLDTKGGLSTNNTWTGNNTFNGNLNLVNPSSVQNTSVVNFGYIFSNFPNKSDMTINISASSTHSQYPSAKAVWDLSQDIREVAEGKTATYVLSVDETLDSDNYSNYQYFDTDGTLKDFTSKQQLEDYVDGMSCVNSSFNTQNASFTLPTGYLIITTTNLSTLEKYLILRKEGSTGGFTNHNVNLGDVFLITESDLPDRWLSAGPQSPIGAVFSKLETFNTTDYAKLSADNTFTGQNSFEDDTTFNNYVYLDKDVVPNTSASINLGSSTKSFVQTYTLYIGVGLTKQAYTPYIYNAVYGVMSVNTTTEIKWSYTSSISVNANTTFTFESPETNCTPEYRAIIYNSHSTDSITLTFTGVYHILCNDDNITITNATNSTLVLPAQTSIEISVFNGNMVAINWSAN